MANIFDVANYICKSIGGELSTMKLQKLCYYSQSWHLVWTGDPLFDNDFFRWDNGPVCRELFNVHQGLFTMRSELIKDNLLSNNGLTADERSSVDIVLETYGGFSGGDLSELTHKEDPWKNTKKDAVIRKDDIKEYYTNLLATAHAKKNSSPEFCNK